MSLRGRQITASIAPTCRLLIVTVGGVRVAMHADHIAGLLTRHEAGPLETLTVQDLTYPKMDLAGRLGLVPDPEGSDTRIVLFSKGQHRANILVSQVHGLKELAQSQVFPLPRQFHREERNWYQGIILFEEGVALVLTPAWIVEGCASVSAHLEEGGRVLTNYSALAKGRL